MGSMGKFLASEKLFQSQFRAVTAYFSDQAKSEGIYKDQPRSFCLPVEFAAQNLVPEIREKAIVFFNDLAIKWHDGLNGNPSNHLCDSQVCCVNFLFPFADNPSALKRLLLPIFPDIGTMLPVENGMYVSFEWIGRQNYLGERISFTGKRTRGANFTSADSIVIFERIDGKRQIVLIEWKYTESYGGNFKKFSASGTDRTQIYRHLVNQEDCPIDLELLPSFDALFYEPFYQFMRQQLLAHEMEKVQEMGADIVSVLHIAPAHNRDFRKVTSPELNQLGDSATGVWKKLVKTDGRFVSVYTEDMFGNLSEQQFPELKAWLGYIQQRYLWLRQ
jgi:hypothetical protein